MKHQFIKACAIITAFALLLTSVPYKANAAAAPAFKLTRSSLYDNSKAKGVYTYTVKNLKKGYKVKWSVTGTGKNYIKFSKAATTTAKTTSSTKITYASKNAAVKGKKATITAKVYNTKNKLIKTLKDSVVLKVQATDITMNTSNIKDDLDSLTVGTAYDFDADLAPANTTSTAYWFVEDSTGKDCSSQIDKNGVFTPSKSGSYTIKAIAKNSEKGTSLATDIKTVTVGTSLNSVQQIAANQFTATFNMDVKNIVKASDFSIRASAGTSTLLAKAIKFSKDGKTATVTTHTNFKDGTVYTITYDTFAKTLTASVGEVKDIKILTTSVQANKATELEYALYDENGIDVKAAVKGSVTYDGEVPNGYITSDNKLFMTKEGKEASITMTYISADDTKFTATQKISCVPLEAEEAASYKFTLTNSVAEPDFTASDFKQNTTISIDDIAYAHFCAFDEAGKKIDYDKVSYTSSNDETLIINSNGSVIPVKEGTVKIIVTLTQGKSEITYPVTVVVIGKRTLANLSLSSHSVTMSNSYEADYERVIKVTGKDQYGNTLDISDSGYTLDEVNNKSLPVTYNSATQEITIKTGASALKGTYNYKFSITYNQKTITSSFVVVVTNIPSTGAVGYVAEVSNPTFDMKVDKTTKSNPVVTIRLAKYISGVFAEYTTFNSASIRKNNLYYTEELTGNTSTTEVLLPASNKLEINPMKLTYSKNAVGECKKAPIGSYSIALKYYDNNGNLKTTTIALNLTDTQAKPTISLKTLESEHTVTNALALVNECLSVSEGVFDSCTATGTSLTGDSISINSGDKVHVKTVTVKSIIETTPTTDGSMNKVYVYHTIDVGRTLTNK